MKRLYRAAGDRYVAGVCGGVAEYFDVDPLLVRILWTASVFLGGIGVLSYIAAWIIIPENPHQSVVPSAERDPERSRNLGLLAGILLIFLGLLFLSDNLHYHFRFPWGFRNLDFGLLASIVVIGLGAYLIFHKKEDAHPAQETGDAAAGARKVTRSVTNRKIGGVCGGLAKYFNLDPSLVRIGFVVLGVGAPFILLVAYVAMMIVIPEDTEDNIADETGMPPV